MKKECADKISKLCAKDLRSFNIVSGEGFREFVEFILQSGATLGVGNISVDDFLLHPTTVSRRTLAMANVEREKLLAEVKKIIKSGK